MDTRTLGRTGLEVSVLGFGCGAVGGLMVRGSPGDQERAVARAIELGINYFDTAAMYGNGESERNLGRVFATAQVSSTLPNQTAGPFAAPGSPAHNFGNLLPHPKAADMGVIAIRVLAAGALSGTEQRHPLGSPSVEPIGSGSSYRADV